MSTRRPYIKIWVPEIGPREEVPAGQIEVVSSYTVYGKWVAHIKAPPKFDGREWDARSPSPSYSGRRY
jgi:hypothetical protein